MLIELYNENITSLFDILLKDKNTDKNIIWCTNDYLKYGENYRADCEITRESLNDMGSSLVDLLQPRVTKSKEIQKGRTKARAEVFTPSWLCDYMNNYCEQDWFNKNKKRFDSEKKLVHKDFLKSYIDLRKLEITCGEAPFVVSCYDTVSGNIIPLYNRIGFLDKKLTAICHYIDDMDEWFNWVCRAYESSYGYEYQGDNLFKARLNLVQTFLDYYEKKWNNVGFPTDKQLEKLSRIIVRNFWQMDGLTYTVPMSDIKCKVHNWRSKKDMNILGEDSMKFDYVIGNPPYQDGRKQIYVYFFEQGKKIGNVVDMIFPTGWQEPKTANCLSVLNKKEVKEDKQIVFIENKEDVFVGIEGAKYTNIVLWKKGYDNKLDGKQLVITPKNEKTVVELKTEYDESLKPSVILSIVDKVKKLNEKTIENLVSTRKPYGFEADPLDNPQKYNINLLEVEDIDTVRLFGRMSGEGRTYRYIKREQLPKVSSMLDTYKLFLVKAWGNMDEKKGFLGGSYSPIIIAEPKDCCSEMYIEVGPFKTLEETKNAQKYFYTKFFRAVFYKRKMSQNTARETYSDVPIQNFTNNSDIDWSVSVSEIDKQLYKKYGLDKDEIVFIEEKIKEME